MRAWMHRAAGVVLAAAVAACGGGGDDGRAGSNGDGSEVLRILVTNDDGVTGAGMDALVEGLEALSDADVTVVAPAEDRSGTGDTVSETPPRATEVALASGHEAVAVTGYPADAVVYALDQLLDERPHVVVSGVNEGQNLGPVVYASGTVGAARTAARRGIPALAVSQGLADTIDYDEGVDLAVAWVAENREALLDGEVGTESVVNLNVPSCPTGEVRGVVEVARAADGGDLALAVPDCQSTARDPADDVSGFLAGYATVSEVPVDQRN